jgi:formiminotetrahydrofolate cyclodeaminase
MVARLTIGRKKYAAVEEQMKSLLERAETLRSELSQAVQKDAGSFESLMRAYRLPKETPEQQQERQRAVEAATLYAAQVPLEVAGMAVAVVELAAEVVASGNLNAISDGASSAAMAQAALASAGYNVRINAKGLQDQDAARAMIGKLRELDQRAAELAARVRLDLEGRGGMPLG